MDAFVTISGAANGQLDWRIKRDYATANEELETGSFTLESDVGAMILLSADGKVQTLSACWLGDRWEMSLLLSDDSEPSWPVIAAENTQHAGYAALHVSCPNSVTIHCENL